MIIKKPIPKGTRLSTLLEGEESKQYFCGRVNGIVRNLDYIVEEDCPNGVEFLDMKDSDGARLYEASLRFLTVMAVKEIDKRLDVRFFYNISRSIFCRVIGKKNFRVTMSFVDKVRRKMQEIVEKDIPIERIKISKKEAHDIYKASNLHDKSELLRYRKENFVHLFKAQDGDFVMYDYLYTSLVPSTGLLSQFELMVYEPGFLLRTPRADCGGKIPVFGEELKFASTLAGTSRWAERNEIDTVPNINKFLKKYGDLALVNLSESRINNMLTDLGRDIVERDDLPRLICIAGPSSSGKTSFANRLTYQLMSLGIRPIRISIDNFYIPKDQMIPGTDIESVDAIDIDYFSSVVHSLIQGEKVALPIYSFKEGKRTIGKELHLNENQPLVIEGIHALNQKLTHSFPESQKYKIYIAPQPQVNIDNHTPLIMSDLRLIRRISRDARTRGSDAKETIGMWPNVRNGEFKYIYPTEENADFIFDSFMHYETCAMRNICMPLLEKITKEDPEYPTATRLMSTLKYFTPIDNSLVPCNSLLREFIGGSSFKDAR